ncbi:MAG TPA: cytochrome c [Acetobacteraceae bacterium]|nr:cytochrome c [Acetobacteraceae bacterium]
MTRRRIPPLVLLLALATCAREDMFVQQRAVPWGAFSFLPHGMTMQPPVANTVARNAPDSSVPQPATISEALLSRGQQEFNISCAPCHGRSGDGEGMIVQRGFPKPPPLFNDDLIKAKAQHFYDVITNGLGVMYSYADRVSSADRWAIVAYIRALQRSQHARVAELSAQDKARLQEAGP